MTAILVIITLLAVLVMGMGAVYITIRLWRKEKRPTPTGPKYRMQKLRRLW